MPHGEQLAVRPGAEVPHPARRASKTQFINLQNNAFFLKILEFFLDKICAIIKDSRIYFCNRF